MSHLLGASCHDAAFSNQTYDATPDIFSSRLKTPVYRNATYDGVGNYTRFMRAYLGLKELTDVQPLVADMVPVINDVTSFQYPLRIASCREKVANNTNHRSIFVAVISAPNNFKKRAAIRRTWPHHFKNQAGITSSDFGQYKVQLAYLGSKV
uniref:Hexosyltransferase n=1 Tax=Daphnia galeata TaxID=27404 RepID=A0A8J2WPC6_9CRUS|nr:unnamed protein product [Daphnia galeata]